MFAASIDLPGLTEEQARAIEDEVGAAMPDGLVAHVAGPYDGGWRIVDVWESQQAQERFVAEVLTAARERALGGAELTGEPDVRTVHAVLSRV